MFDTGIKEAIVNVAGDIDYNSTSGILRIQDVGSFNVNSIYQLSITAPRAARSTSSTHDTITVTGLSGTAELATVKLKFKSLKAGFAGYEDGTELGHKTFSCSFNEGTNDNAASAIATALNGDKDAYGIYSVSATTNAVNIIYSDPSLSIDTATVIGEHNSTSSISLALTHPVAADLGRGTAKELKDSVRAATKVNTGSEEHTLERQVDMNSTYYTISFDYTTANLDYKSDALNGYPSQNARFMIYVNNNAYTPDKTDNTEDLNVWWVAYEGTNNEATTIAGFLADTTTPIYLAADDTVGYPG